MKRKQTLYGVVEALLLLTVVLTAVHLLTRERVPKGALAVSCRGKTVYVDLDDLPQEEVSGVVVNGKGEEKEVRGQAVSVAAVLRAAGIDLAGIGTVTVTAEDEYSVQLLAPEVAEPGKAWLAQEDGGVRLIVFGDTNAKRNVRGVTRLDVR